MRTLDAALDLHDARIAVAAVDATGAIKAPATMDRRAICAAFRDTQYVPAAVVGSGLLALRFHGDEPYRKTVEGIRAKDGSLFNRLAVMRSPSGKWTVLVRVQGGVAPAGEVLAKDKDGNVLAEVMADGDLVQFGGTDGPVWRQGNLKTIPTLPLASVALLLESAKATDEAPEAEPEPVTEPITDGAVPEAEPEPVEEPCTEARQAGPDLPDL